MCYKAMPGATGFLAIRGERIRHQSNVQDDVVGGSVVVIQVIGNPNRQQSTIKRKMGSRMRPGRR